MVYKPRDMFSLDHSRNVLVYLRLFKDKRYWQIFIRLVSQCRKPGSAIMSVDEYPMKQEYVDGTADPPNGAVAEIWSEYGVVTGKQVVSDPTYKFSGVRGNAVQRAVVFATHKFEKKKIGGYLPSGTKKNKCKNQRFLPMLAKVFVGKMKYPVLVQPKLDGTRMVAHLDVDGNVDLYSRQLKTVSGKDKIREELKRVLRPGMYLDGEFYEHGVLLQKTSSRFRTASNEGEFWVFDVFFPCASVNMSFRDRYAELEKLFAPKFSVLKIVPTTLENNFEDVQKLMRKFKEENYEGAIVRDPDSTYVCGKRSSGVQKLKETQTAEYPVVDIVQGVGGKSRGALIFVLETGEGVRFKSIPVGSLGDRRREFEELSADDNKKFREKLEGKCVSVEFEDLSEDKVPLRSKVIGVRPYK